MPKFTVTVEYTQKKEISVYADDEDEAEEKAVAVVLKWQNVEDAEAVDCCEE